MINYMVQLTQEQYTKLYPMGHNEQTEESNLEGMETIQGDEEAKNQKL